MKTAKRTILIFISFCTVIICSLACFLTACNNDEPLDVAVTDVTLNKSSLVLDRDESFKLIATINPVGADGTVLFSSDDPAIAKVNPDGTVTGVGAGETVIKAYVGTDISAECTVRVGYNVTIETDSEGEVTYDNRNFYGGETVYLLATPADGYIFDGWYKNGTLLSNEKSYGYTVTGDAAITAKFIILSYPDKNEKGFYEIKNVYDLIWATEDGTENYILVNDITANPDFCGFDDFSGIFDGNGYTINSVSTDNGFFNKLSGTVKNLTLSNVSCNGTELNTGLLAGEVSAANIENCHVQGSITLKEISEGYFAGGLIGYVDKVGSIDTVIKNCSAEVIANINENNHGYFGGLIGYLKGGRISFCCADVTANAVFKNNPQYWGGLIGETFYSIDTVYDCYATGSITAKVNTPDSYGNNIYVGGMFAENYGIVERCYSAVDITLTGGAEISDSSLAGVCAINLCYIKDGLYCGNFSIYDEATGYAYAFANNNEDPFFSGSTQNVYVLEGAADFEFTDNPQQVTAEQLTEEFFKNTLNFGDGWIFEKNKLPHF